MTCEKLLEINRLNDTIVFFQRANFLNEFLKTMPLVSTSAILEIISRFILLGQLYLLMYVFLQVPNRLETEAIIIK